MAVAEFVREEAGLVWLQGKDYVWRAAGTGGTFAVSPGPRMDHVAWFIPRGGLPVHLGTYQTLGAAYGAARRYNPSSGQMAAEESSKPTVWLLKYHGPNGQREALIWANSEESAKGMLRSVVPDADIVSVQHEPESAGMRGRNVYAMECSGGCGEDCGCASCKSKHSHTEQTVNVLAAEAPEYGWTSGRKPTHQEIWANGKPLTIVKKGRGWTLLVMGQPVVEGPGGGATFHGRSDFNQGLPEYVFKKKSDVESVAFGIGQYMLGLGQFMDTYVHHTTAGGTAEHAAEETARVLYEDRPRSAKPLRWHRTKFGYEAKGMLGRYSIVKVPADRRKGVLPILLSLNDTPIKQFDLKQEAVLAAARYEKGEQIKPGTLLTPAGGHCGPLARIAVDPAAATACKARADVIGPIDSIQDVYRLMHAELASFDNEVFAVVPLNVQGLLIQAPVRVGEGQRSKVTVDTADILRAVILSGASSYWCVHWHPSGKAKPSSADKHLTEVVQRASDAAFGKSRGVNASVKFLGHAVIGSGQVADARTGRIYKVK